MQLVASLSTAETLDKAAWVWLLFASIVAALLVFECTGFLIEKSLPLDNAVVIAIVLGFFAILRQYLHRVLFKGSLGVTGLQAMTIGLGATLVTEFGRGLYRVGAFPVFTGTLAVTFGLIASGVLVSLWKIRDRAVAASAS